MKCLGELLGSTNTTTSANPTTLYYGYDELENLYITNNYGWCGRNCDHGAIVKC